MAKIKVSADQLKKIISEEASRYKKVLELQKQKEAIMSELKKISELEDSPKDKDKDKPHAVDGKEVREEKPKTQSEKSGKK